MKPRLILFSVLILTAVAYAGMYEAGYAWDDYSLVRDNAYTKDWANLGAFFSLDLWETTRLAPHASGFYRPLFLTSLAVDHSLFGLHAGGAHLHSVGWHLLAAALLFQFARRLDGAFTGLMAATLFALHPVQHEAVALIAARNDSMAAALVFLSLILLYEPASSRRRLFGGGTVFFLALLSKESALFTPIVLWALDRSRGIRGGQRARYASLFIAMVAYLCLRSLSSVGDNPWPTAEQWQTSISHLPAILGTYSEMLLWPSTLTPARSVSFLDTTSELLPFLLFGLAGVVALLRAARRKPAIGACLLWAALCLAPTALVTIGKGNLGERYLYLPMAGLSLAVAMALPKSKATGLLLGGFALLSLSQILPRNNAWTDYATLWKAAYEDRPSAFTAAGYGWAKENIEKDPLGARELYMEALRSEPAYHSVCEAAVLVNVRLKRFESGVAVADWAHQERGCPPTPMFSDALLYSLGGSGQFQRIQALFGGNSDGPRPSPGAVLTYAAQRRDAEGVENILRRSPNAGVQLNQALFFADEIVRDAETASWLRAQTSPALAGVESGRSP